MALQYLPGRLAVAYFNEGNLKLTDSNPIATEISSWLGQIGPNAETLEALNVMDASYDVASEFADATTRETAKTGFRSEVPVLKNGQVSFSIRWLPNEDQTASAPYTFTELLLKAWGEDSTIAMVFLDYACSECTSVGPGNPGLGNNISPQGLAANWSVSLSKEENLGDVQKANVTLSVSDHASWWSGAQITGS